MSKLKILELFAGIGACSKALERLGIDFEIVDAVEIDKYAVKSFNAIHNTNFEPQDITKWDKDIQVDLIMHGSPCVDFSIAGKQAGGDKGSGTRSSLMYETIRIVEKLKPKYVVWENVKNLLSKTHKHNFDNYLKTMENLGYTNYYQVLDAKDYGVPQHRERVYTISILNGDFAFPPKQELKLKLKDLLEDEVDEKYYLKDYQIERIKYSKYKIGAARIQEKEYCDTLCARDWKDPKCVQVGNLSGGKWDKMHESCRRVYDADGISPTLHTCQGGNTETKIMIKNNTKETYLKTTNNDNLQSFISEKYGNFIKENGYIPEMFNPYNEKEIKNIAPSQTCFCGSMTSSATVLIKNNTKQGYLYATDGDGLYITNMDKKRGTVQKGMIPTLKTSPDIGVVVEDLKIRKLTPKECWRLMGFDDKDFEKSKAIGTSNSQLYKQAGNSIVVNVLEAIFKNLDLPKKWDDLY